MKKFLNFTMAFALIFSMSMSSMAVHAEPATVSAAIEAAEVAANMALEPRAHTSYYPVSGYSSGVFSGNYSNYAIYGNLPSTVALKISYSIEGASTCYLQFYQNGKLIQTSNAMGNGTGTTSVNLLYSGQYSVRLYYPNGNSSSEVIFAYNLYTE